ncbi:hypothetical protein M885DRAFT_581019 [Pelagophyceae sp. CCMP2097]|nr:hypothetical protein M885DRAFT_581019 [Pelagophyceae sp. CCMP2097]
MEQDPNAGAIVVYDPDAAGVATTNAPTTGVTFHDLFGGAESSSPSMLGSNLSVSEYDGDLDEPFPVVFPVRAVALLRPSDAIVAEEVDAKIYAVEDAEVYAFEVNSFKSDFAPPVYEGVGGPFNTDWVKEREAFCCYLDGPHPAGDKMAAKTAQNYAHIQEWLMASHTIQNGNLVLLGEQHLPAWTTIHVPCGFVSMQIGLAPLPEETPVEKMAKALKLRRLMEPKSLSALESQMGQLSQLNETVSITIKEMGIKIDPPDSWYNAWTTSDGKTTNGEHFGIFLLEQSKCEFSYYVAPRPG